MNIDLTPSERVTKGKILLRRRHPFFSQLLLSLNTIEDGSVPTVGVDFNANMVFNPNYIKTLKIDEIQAVLTHEVLHCAFGHMMKQPPTGTDMKIMNVAMDIVINNHLVKESMKLPKGCLLPNNDQIELDGKNGKKFTVNKIPKKTSLTIYDEIINKIDKQKYQNGQDQHKFGKNLSKQKKNQLKQQWKQKLASAAEYARKQKGKVPGDIQTMIEKLLHPKINWNEYLRKYISSLLPFDFTYMKRSKRSIACGYYMPGVLKEKLEIVASLDTSGSMGKRELEESLTELHAIASLSPNIEIDVIVCDTQVNGTTKLTDTNVESIPLNGGGGTSHRPIYKHINEKMPATKVLVNFTDGWTSFPDKKDQGHFHSIWVLTGTKPSEVNVPFGTVLTTVKDGAVEGYDDDD